VGEKKKGGGNSEKGGNANVPRGEKWGRKRGKLKLSKAIGR